MQVSEPLSKTFIRISQNLESLAGQYNEPGIIKVCADDAAFLRRYAEALDPEPRTHLIRRHADGCMEWRLTEDGLCAKCGAGLEQYVR